MTEVEFRPIKKVVILEELKYDSLEDFFAAITAAVPPETPITLLWSDGVVFAHQPIPLESEEIVRDRIQGIVYGSVAYARMDEFEGEKSFGMHTIKIVKVTAPALMDVARELKKRL